eukprot:1025778_1
MERRKAIVIEHWMRVLFNKDIYLREVIPIIIAYSHSDFLNLNQNPQCQKMLLKVGENVPEPEYIILSTEIVKINKRRKHQPRVFILTNKAIYLVKPKQLPKCQYRLALSFVTGITVSTHSDDCDEFLLLLPEIRYNYRQLKCDDRDHIIDSIRLTCEQEVPLNQTVNPLELSIPPKPNSRPTRTDRYRRYKESLEKVEYGDEIQDLQGKVTTQLMHQAEAVTADDFEFIKVIGKDKIGTFLLVRKKDSQQLFAMQIVRQDDITDLSNSEYETRRNLQHPFLMQIRWAFQTITKLYHIFDYNEDCGELLFHLKKKRRFTEAEAQFFVGQIALALGQLHSMNVIYKELSAESIWLDATGNIILMEQGLSVNNFNGVYVPEYLSPERIETVSMCNSGRFDEPTAEPTDYLNIHTPHTADQCIYPSIRLSIHNLLITPTQSPTLTYWIKSICLSVCLCLIHSP